MIQLQVRIEQKRSGIVAPSNFQPTGEVDVDLELLSLNANKPEADLGRKIAEKISFWLNASNGVGKS